MERKYTVAEIDRMRKAIEWSYPCGVSFQRSERDADVENRLRTYMQNGTDPEELEAIAKKRIEIEVQSQRMAREKGWHPA